VNSVRPSAVRLWMRSASASATRSFSVMVAHHPHDSSVRASDPGKASRGLRSALPFVSSPRNYFMDLTSRHSVATGQRRQDQLNVDLQRGIPIHYKSCHSARFESRCSILVRSDPLWRGEAAQSFAAVAQLGFLRSADDGSARAEKTTEVFPP
jgi:hypothetical protein